MERVLYVRTFSIIYFIKAAIVSFALTSILYCTVLNYSYCYVLIHETKCPVPPLRQFIEISEFMSTFLIAAVLTNILVDYLSWSVTQTLISQLVRVRGVIVLAVLIATVILITCMLWFISQVYLSLSIVSDMMIDLRLAHFTLSTILKTYKASHNAWGLVGIPEPIFYVNCNGGRSIFMIGNIETSRVLIAETILPYVILIFTTIGGVIVYMSRPATRRPFAFILDRMESSNKTVIILIGGVLLIVTTVVTALFSSNRSSGPH